MSDRDELYGNLAHMWSSRDPMPGDLVEKVLVALATEDVDAEYELLHLVERSRTLAGARGSGDDAITIEFSRGSFSLLLRVSPADADMKRIDGWVSPAKPMKVSVRREDRTWETSVGQLGRFELTGLPAGLVRVFLESDDGVDDAAEQLFATPTFEI